MIATHSVKHNGVWYKPGENIPETASEVVSSLFPESQETVENGKLKKSDISRMSTANLKSLANEQGINGAEDMSGADLKKVLIEHFGF